MPKLDHFLVFLKSGKYDLLTIKVIHTPNIIRVKHVYFKTTLSSFIPKILEQTRAHVSIITMIMNIMIYGILSPVFYRQMTSRSLSPEPRRMHASLLKKVKS